MDTTKRFGLPGATITLTLVTLLLVVLLVSLGNSPISLGGTALAHDAPNNICDRVEAVQNAIRAALNRTGASCEDVSVHSSRYHAITRLTVSSGQLETLPSGSFYNLIGLESLRINSMGLDELPDDIFDGLSNLRILSLSWNDLEGLPEDIFDGLSNLTHIYISGNELTALNQDVFDGLNSLRWLDLSDNELAALPADVFEDLDGLEILYLSNNELTTLPADVFDDLDSLEILSLTDNELTTLPVDVFDDLDSVVGLYLGYNDLALGDLPSDFFDSFTSLRGLGLNGIGKDYEGDDGGSLTSLNYAWWDGLTGLRALGLNNNELATLPIDTFEGFSSLTTLDLGNNDLTTLPADVFEDQTDLERLRLQQNQLTALPADLLDGLTQLEQLYLHENQLTALPDGLFEGITELNSLKLALNPGAPFTLTAELERDKDNDGVVVKVAEGAPFNIEVTLTAEGGSLSHDTAIVPAGDLTSTVVAITADTGETEVTVNMGSASFVGTSYSIPEGIGASPGASLTVSVSGVAPALVNNEASGAPRISFLTMRVGYPLAADASSTIDPDGLENVVYSYQWLADSADIAGATSSTYTIQSADVGKTIQVRVTFTDDRGNEESLTSAATPAVLGIIVSGITTTDYAENGTSTVATYAATGATRGATVTWSLSRDDSGEFSISSSGVLTFSSSPDYESPTDSDTDNVYEVTINASDGTSSGTLDVTITVTDVNEGPVMTTN